QEAVRQAGLKPIQFIDGVIRFTAIISREPLDGAHAADLGSPQQKSDVDPRQSSPTVPSSRQEAVLLALRSLRHPAGIDDIMGALP
ncbi:TrmB family transcriptional regulator, partial [Burkholderia multivorans]